MHDTSRIDSFIYYHERVHQFAPSFLSMRNVFFTRQFLSACPAARTQLGTKSILSVQNEPQFCMARDYDFNHHNCGMNYK